MDIFLENIANDKIIVALAIFILLDTFLGCIRTILEKKWNSCFGINGLLRKVAMLGSIIFLIVIDYIFKINFISFVPQDIMKYFGNIKIGISALFSILFILYESTSILKNMVLCGLPVPEKIRKKTIEILEEFTSELEKKDR